jgi:hypothetical protein
MSRQLDITLELVAAGVRALVLRERSKLPWCRKGERRHVATHDADEVRDHLRKGRNVGLYAGSHAVLDFDDLAGMRAMFDALGPLTPTVVTGSGKVHVYAAHASPVTGRLIWSGKRVGEVKRGVNEYVVAPPSVHPNGSRYRWVADPRGELARLPAAWEVLLQTAPRSGGGVAVPSVLRPDHIPADTLGVPPDEPWSGPAPSELKARALTQPGAVEVPACPPDRPLPRITFQCPGCRAEQRDINGKNHAVLFESGKWGCVVVPEHRLAIGAALGVTTVPLTLGGLERALLAGLL